MSLAAFLLPLCFFQVCRIDGRCDCLSDTNDHTVAVGFDHVIFVIVGLEGFPCVGDSFQDLYFVAFFEGLGGLGVWRNFDFLADADQVCVCDPVIGRSSDSLSRTSGRSSTVFRRL